MSDLDNYADLKVAVAGITEAREALQHLIDRGLHPEIKKILRADADLRNVLGSLNYLARDAALAIEKKGIKP